MHSSNPFSLLLFRVWCRTRQYKLTSGVQDLLPWAISLGKDRCWVPSRDAKKILCNRSNKTHTHKSNILTLKHIVLLDITYCIILALIAAIIEKKKLAVTCRKPMVSIPQDPKQRVVIFFSAPLHQLLGRPMSVVKDLATWKTSSYTIKYSNKNVTFHKPWDISNFILRGQVNIMNYNFKSWKIHLPCLGKIRPKQVEDLWPLRRHGAGHRLRSRDGLRPCAARQQKTWLKLWWNMVKLKWLQNITNFSLWYYES